MPKPAADQAPIVYPVMSERLREDGKVIVRVVLRASGEVVSVQVAKSSGYRRLDDAALAWVSSAQFVGGVDCSGESRDMAFLVPVIFEVESDEAAGSLPTVPH